MLDVNYCRQRQKRLLDRMQQRKLDAIVVGLPHHVYYLSAHLNWWLHQSAFVLFADGKSWLTTANSPASRTAAQEVVCFEANRMSTLRQDQPDVIAHQVQEVLGSRRASRVGFDTSPVASQVLHDWSAEAEPIDADLWQLRRRKDPDELELMKTAIRCTEAMYARAREIIEPGVSELHVFGELHQVAVRTSGEPMTALLGNDFACGVLGGPPRNGRVAQAGEIYILDLGPTYRGYFSDNARSFAVDRKPTDAQLKAHDAILGALRIVEKMAKPGVRCRDIFSAVDEHFVRAVGTNMTHHLGHGVGLQPHEFPHLNPKWDDTLMEGEVVTVEPGLYSPELRGGIRIENQYLVTSAGFENLVDFSTDLA
jgi:Xaa-Pro dipeptidase